MECLVYYKCCAESGYPYDDGKVDDDDDNFAYLNLRTSNNEKNIS